MYKVKAIIKKGTSPKFLEKDGTISNIYATDDIALWYTDSLKEALKSIIPSEDFESISITEHNK